MIRLNIPNMKTAWRTMPQLGEGTKESPRYWNILASTSEDYFYTPLPADGEWGGVDTWVYGRFEDGEEYDFRFTNMMEMDLQVKIYTMNDELLSSGVFGEEDRFELSFEPDETALYKLHIQTYDSYGTPKVGVNPAIPAIDPYVERTQGLAWTVGYDERDRLEKFNTMPELPALPPYNWDWTKEWDWWYRWEREYVFYTGAFELDYKRWGNSVKVYDRSILGRNAEYTLQKSFSDVDDPEIKYGGLYLPAKNNDAVNNGAAYFTRDVTYYDVRDDESAAMSFEIYIDKFGSTPYFTIASFGMSSPTILLYKDTGISVGPVNSIPLNGPMQEGVTYGGFVHIGPKNPDEDNYRKVELKMWGSDGSRFEYPDPRHSLEWQQQYFFDAQPRLPIGRVGCDEIYPWAVSIIRASIRTSRLQHEDEYFWWRDDKWVAKRVRLPKIGLA